MSSNSNKIQQIIGVELETWNFLVNYRAIRSLILFVSPDFIRVVMIPNTELSHDYV